MSAGTGREEFLRAFHSELLGCLVGLKQAASMGTVRIILETDASLARSAMKDDDHRLSEMGNHH